MVQSFGGPKMGKLLLEILYMKSVFVDLCFNDGRLDGWFFFYVCKPILLFYYKGLDSAKHKPEHFFLVGNTCTVNLLKVKTTNHYSLSHALSSHHLISLSQSTVSKESPFFQPTYLFYLPTLPRKASAV